MKQFILGLILLLSGSQMNALFYQTEKWAGDFLYIGKQLYGKVQFGYAFSIGDVLQVLGLALCMFGLFKILNLTQHLPLVNRTSGLDLRYSELQRYLRK